MDSADEVEAGAHLADRVLRVTSGRGASAAPAARADRPRGQRSQRRQGRQPNQASRRTVGTALLAAFLALTACSGGSASSDTTGRTSAATPTPNAATARTPSSTTSTAGPGGATAVRVAPAGDVVTGLDTPWGIAVLPDGDALVSSRDTGAVTRFGPHTPRPVPVGTVPGSVHHQGGEDGLLGLALSPHWTRDHLVYAYLTTASDNRIVRMTYTGDGGLGPARPVLTGIPAGTIHNGGRIAFGPDGMLYAGTGEANHRGLAQDRGSLGGKILRMTPDGTPAPGNPFPGSLVYSLGHRDVQGIAWDGQNRLWASEFGDHQWDELNLITPGGNYGWPAVEGRGGNGRYLDPQAVFRPSEGSPSGLAVVGDVAYLACLRGQRLWQVPLSGGRAGAPRPWLVDTYGRLRTVLPQPGGLWLSTSNTDGRGTPRPGDDRVLRITLLPG